MKLSVIIIAKNEAENISDCLASVAFADEIIVVDDNSTDDTARLAKNAGATVYQRAMEGGFAGQQNFAIEKAQGDWLLLLDCDERITAELAREIQAVMKVASCTYYIRRLNHFAKRRVRFGTLRVDKVCRLLPNKGVYLEGLVHPKVMHDFAEKTLKQPMLHFTYASWTQYYKKFEQYTRLSAQKYAEQGRRVNVLRDFLLRPLWAFIKMYVIHAGFLDGKIGWILAVNHYHYTLAKYVRLYAIQRDGEQAL